MRREEDVQLFKVFLIQITPQEYHLDYCFVNRWIAIKENIGFVNIYNNFKKNPQNEIFFKTNLQSFQHS